MPCVPSTCRLSRAASISYATQSLPHECGVLLHTTLGATRRPSFFFSMPTVPLSDTFPSTPARPPARPPWPPPRHTARATTPHRARNRQNGASEEHIANDLAVYLGEDSKPFAHWLRLSTATAGGLPAPASNKTRPTSASARCGKMQGVSCPFRAKECQHGACGTCCPGPCKRHKLTKKKKKKMQKKQKKQKNKNKAKAMTSASARVSLRLRSSASAHTTPPHNASSTAQALLDSVGHSSLGVGGLLGDLVRTGPPRSMRRHPQHHRGAPGATARASGSGADSLFLPFGEALAFARSLQLKDQQEWEVWRRCGQRPGAMPAHPDRAYKDDGWRGYDHWLGTPAMRCNVMR